MFTIRIVLIAALVAGASPALAQKAVTADPGATISGTATIRIAPDTLPGNAAGPRQHAGVKELTANECRQLGCEVVHDDKCPKLQGVVGTLQRRCICSTGRNMCIDEAGL